MPGLLQLFGTACNSWLTVAQTKICHLSRARAPSGHSIFQIMPLILNHINF